MSKAVPRYEVGVVDRQEESAEDDVADRVGEAAEADVVGEVRHFGDG